MQLCCLPIKKKGGENKIVIEETFVGVDVGKRICVYYIMHQKGMVLKNGKYPNTHAGVAEFIDNTLASYPNCRGICESTARMWIKTYEAFEKRGMPIAVVNPRKLGLRISGAKTDKKDAQRLANKYRVDDIGHAICHVYGQDTRRVIDLLRQMILLKQERTRYLNRQHGICEKYDYTVKAGSSTSGEKHQSYLSSLKLRPGDMVLMEQYVESVRHINGQMGQLEGMVRREAAKNEDAKLIMSITGFDAYGALLVAASIDGIERFKGPKSLVSFFGLHPTTYQSGDTVKHGYMKKDRDGALTHILMNAAMTAKMHDDHMAKIYEGYAKRHPVLVARSHVAHKIAITIYYMLKNRELYRYVNKELYQTKLARLEA